MKKYLILFLTLCFFTIPLFSLTGELVFVDGTVDLKTAGGSQDYADIGMALETGDSIITGYDGYAELEMEDGSVVKINEDSIFKIASFQSPSGNRNNFQLVLGSAGYKFTKAMKDQEPMITTPSTVCGLRGTEFTVLAGIDGSSMYVVDEGSVAVTSNGTEVQLMAEEGVKVKSGEAPGEVFQVLRGKVDYSAFRTESQDSFLSNPSSTVFILTNQLEKYADEADKFESLYKAQLEAVNLLRKELDAKKKEEQSDFYKTVVFPEEVKVSGMKQNVRYYAVSAKSLRRFVIGSMFVEMKTRFVKDPGNPDYQDFMNAYNQFVSIYETRIVPYLVEADIH